MPEFTIPVVLDPIVVAKLDAIKEVTEKLEEAIEELKKITLGTGLVTGVDLNEEEVE